MAVKHTLAAGVAAFALLVTPVGLTAQWNDHGPAISTAPAISMAHAAANRPTTMEPPADGAPTITSSGTTSKTTGYQTGSGKVGDDWCQVAADRIDRYGNHAAVADAAGDSRAAQNWRELAQKVESLGADEGCAFIY
jgi:hypothetical protein